MSSAPGAPRRLVLVKHAMPVIDPSRPAREWRLGPPGEHQARALAAQLRVFVPLRLASSPEPKAARTADLVAGELGIPVVTSDGLRELDRPVLPLMSPDEHRAFNARLFTALDEPVVGAESARAALARFSTAIEALLEPVDRSHVVVVTHGTVISLLVAAHNAVNAVELWQRLQCPSYVVLDARSFELLDVVEDAAAGVRP